MKKYLLAFLLAVIITNAIAVEKGDSLAILYYPVYAYKNPDDFSTRYKGIFSYQNKNKLVFIEESEQYAGYFKVKTHDGDTVFVKANRLSADQNLSQQQIRQEIKEGKRNREFSTFIKLELPDYPWWYYWIAYFVLLLIAYIFYKQYIKFDRWFCRKARSKANPLYSPWFLTYSLAMGLISGVIQFFSPQEYKWFWAEGFQIWGNYPSNWDYIMWGTVIITVIIGFLAFVQAFRRFSPKYAVLYTIISFILIGVYYYIGYLTSALAILAFFLMAMGKGSSESSGTQNYSGDPSPVGAYKYIDGVRHIKNTGGSWDVNE